MTSVEDPKSDKGLELHSEDYSLEYSTIVGYGIRFLIAATLPLLITLSIARIIMFPWFIQVEYARPGFPDDVYGFTEEERLEYAPLVLEYLFNDKEISFLDDLSSDDNVRLFNNRELKHLVDVKVLTQRVFAVLYVGWVIWVIMLVISVRYPRLRRFGQTGLIYGSVFTLTIIGAIVAIIAITWDTFFTSFHNLFFADGTWQFAFSDTLIRLFPEQFWVDAALVVGGLSLLSALCILLLMRYWHFER